MNKFKKILVSTLAMIVAVTSTNANIFAKNKELMLKPGEVTQNKTATWSDYSKGIAEVSFDVIGKNVEEPVDVVIIYDNSGSMQTCEDLENGYLTSRWYYASEAAKKFSDSLLQNDKNNVAFVPFSDVLIDGNSSHTNPDDFFESHDLIYDERGNPDILGIKLFPQFYEGHINGKYTSEEFYKACREVLNLSKEEVDKITASGESGKNTKNAVVPFTKNVEDINDAIGSLYPSNAGETNYEIALKKAQSLFEENNNKDSNKVIVMISDGKPNKGGDSVKVANKLKASGVTIYTCGTAISDADAGALKAIASVENNAPFYCSSKPSDLEKTLETIRKEIGIAAEQAVIEDQINSEYFEYFVDETHYPTVNGVKITDKEIIVSKDKSSITWNIGNIREEKKTLKFYIKVKGNLLNKDLLDKDQSFLNNVGDYATNKKANLSYKEVNSDKFITTGHEMESPKISVSTANMKQTYYLSDASGNYIEENGEKVLLWEETSTKKALGIEYIITPRQSIEIDGVKYFILKEDNKETKKTFSNNDTGASFAYRLVKQLNVIFQDENKNIYKQQTVEYGTAASAPTVPNREGYTFVGWDKDFTNVRSNLVVTAIYEENAVVIVPPTTIPGQPILPSDTPRAPIIPPVVTTPGVVAPITLVQPEALVQGEQTVTPPVANEEIIEDQQVPLAAFGGSWALVNLICTIAVTILGIFLLLAKHKKDEEDEKDTVAYKRRRWTKVATIVVAIVTIVVFMITEDITLPMILTDKWTVAMLILTLVQIVVVCVGRKWKEDKEQQETITA